MYIKIVGDTTKYQGKLERIGLHLIKVSGLIQHTSGFRLYLDNDIMVGDYSTFIYPYLDPYLGEGVFEYSDNNMDWEEESKKPTPQEQEKKKIEEIVHGVIDKEMDSLSNQVDEIENILIPMYEVLLEIEEIIQELIPPEPDEGEEGEDEPVDPIDDNSSDEPIEEGE